MSKQKKRRHKRYRGKDAAMTKPQVTRLQAPERGTFGNWLHDNRDNLKIRAIQLGIVLIVAIIFYWLVF